MGFVFAGGFPPDDPSPAVGRCDPAGTSKVDSRDPDQSAFLLINWEVYGSNYTILVVVKRTGGQNSDACLE